MPRAMPERPLSEYLQNWADHTEWEDDEDEEACRELVDQAKRLEAENARLRAVYEAAVAVVESAGQLPIAALGAALGRSVGFTYTDYGFNGEFDRRMDALADAVRREPGDPNHA